MTKTNSIIDSVDARTRMAGTNKFEALTFSLGINPNTGNEEVFGINVFKVKEVIKAPPITAAPNMPSSVKGLVSLRGTLLPVVDLGEYAGFAPAGPDAIMILTEYNRHTQGFLVKSVDTILRISWEDMKVPPKMINGSLGGLITAVTTLPSGALALMIDVERVLSELSPESQDSEANYQHIEAVQMAEEGIVFFCDDSSIARKQIQRTLESCQIPFKCAINGLEAWQMIEEIVGPLDSKKSENAGNPKRQKIKLVLTDVEMPEMDGYALTKKLKADPRTRDIPVVMHSSLSSNQNQTVGKSVGAEYYIPKFKPDELARVFREFLAK
jgi:two-component system chemotaxis response regulator CheV